MEDTLKRIANDCVRYILMKKSVNDEITSKELQNKVIKDSNIRFSSVLIKMQKILKGVYGLKLVKKTATTNKFILWNILPYIPNISVENNDDTTNVKNNILFLVLAHIFLSNGEASYDSIKRFLMELITDELDIDLKQYVTQTLVKDNYLKLNKETDMYNWGFFALENFNMMDILQFTAGVMNLPSIHSYTQQYEMALTQQLNQNQVVESNNEDSN